VRATGFSLWLIPEGAVRHQLRERIQTLARRFATPVFEPHLTLVGGVSGPAALVRETAARVARGTRAFPVLFVSTAHSEDYFRCVVLEADLSSTLAAAHRAALTALGRTGAPAFHPHLSLVYGSLLANTRAAVCAELASLCPLSCDVGAIEVVETDGAVESWRTVESLSLSR
jgi:2'-5' RNA ligase